MEGLLHQTAAPIQLQVQPKDSLLKTSRGKKRKYSIAHPRGPRARANGHLDVNLGDKGPPHALGGPHCPLGTRGREKLTNSALGDWDMAPSIAGNIPRTSRP